MGTPAPGGRCINGYPSPRGSFFNSYLSPGGAVILLGASYCRQQNNPGA